MIRKVLEWFGGSVVVYVLVAACAGSGALDDTDEQVAGTPIDADGDGVPDGMDTDGDGMIDQPMPAGDGGGMNTIINPVPEADAAEDGTRIVNRYRTTPGGLRTATSGFYDTEREEACQFLPTASGDRCLPAAPYETLNIQGLYFSDASCTVPLAQSTYGCVTPRYAGGYVLTDGDACTASYVYEYYEVGTLHAGTVYIGTADNCNEYASIPASTILYALGARIPDTDFAEGNFQNGG